MRSNPGRLAIAIAVAISACAPALEGPIDHQRAIDRDDGDRLAAQLARLPGVVAASVILHRAARDPLAVTAPSPPSLSAVLGVDDKADPAALRAQVLRVARAQLPELAERGPPIEIGIEIDAIVHRPTLVKVGPFWVDDGSRGALRATLALGCLAIAALAALVAVLARRARDHRLGNSAQ
jgi:hypothetical protein